MQRALESRFADPMMPAELGQLDWIACEAGRLTLGADFHHVGEMPLDWLCEAIQEAISDLFVRPGSAGRPTAFDWHVAYLVDAEGKQTTRVFGLAPVASPDRDEAEPPQRRHLRSV